MGVFGLIVSLAIVLSLNTEEACMVLSAHAKRLRSDEIYEFIDQHPDFDIGDLHTKIQEDTFNLCLGLITLQESSEVLTFEVPVIEKYFHLVTYPFSKYSSSADLAYSPAFNAKRAEVMLRLVQHRTKEL